MKKNILIIFVFIISASKVMCQENVVLLKEAENLERSLKEPEALDKYKLILAGDPTNIKALVKSAELSCMIGARIENKNDKRLNFESALSFAKRALTADNNNADANYAIAMVSGKMTEIETDNKKIVSYARDVKLYADKAIIINPKHAKATFTEGRWHFEMTTLNSLKRTAAKIFFGGLPTATLDSAIIYMEKCKTLDPYLVINYYYLNKAYKEDNKPTKQIELLNKMIKLPTRTIDDVAMKAEATKELAALQ